MAKVSVFVEGLGVGVGRLAKGLCVWQEGMRQQPGGVPKRRGGFALVLAALSGSVARRWDGVGCRDSTRPLPWCPSHESRTGQESM